MTDSRSRPLNESDLDRDALRQFENWFGEARRAGLPLAEAMALATATPDGAPSVRMVLLKGFDERGFTFHSGYESRKGRELAENARAALLFYWHELGRQVRIEGPVIRVEQEESESYFRTRPPRSRAATWASSQSEVIGSREELESRFEKLLAEYGEGQVPLPPAWGGYRVEPETFEFWQHRENRLHDRLRYRRDGERWVIERLAP